MSLHALDCSREAKRLVLLADQVTTPTVKAALRDRAGDFVVLAEGGSLPPERMRELHLTLPGAGGVYRVRPAGRLDGLEAGPHELRSHAPKM
jgi:hypothetical protein